MYLKLVRFIFLILMLSCLFIRNNVIYQLFVIYQTIPDMQNVYAFHVDLIETHHCVEIKKVI